MRASARSRARPTAPQNCTQPQIRCSGVVISETPWSGIGAREIDAAALRRRGTTTGRAPGADDHAEHWTAVPDRKRRCATGGKRSQKLKKPGKGASIVARSRRFRPSSAAARRTGAVSPTITAAARLAIRRSRNRRGGMSASRVSTRASIFAHASAITAHSMRLRQRTAITSSRPRPRATNVSASMSAYSFQSPKVSDAVPSNSAGALPRTDAQYSRLRAAGLAQP